MTNSLVSIVITTQNRRNLLERALLSSIKQTYKYIEILVIDDGSTDDTEDFIITYQKQYSNIKYIKNKEIMGANYSRNVGIKNARGKYIAGLDDDDEFTHNRIEVLVLNYNPKYAFVTSNSIVILKKKTKKIHNKQYVNFEDMLYRNHIGNQALIERERLIKVGFFDETLTACQDYDMWIRLIKQYGMAYNVNDFLQVIHMEHEYGRISSAKKVLKGYFKFYKKYKKYMQLKDRKKHLFMIYRVRKKKMLSKNFINLLFLEDCLMQTAWFIRQCCFKKATK